MFDWHENSKIDYLDFVHLRAPVLVHRKAILSWGALYGLVWLSRDLAFTGYLP